MDSDYNLSSNCETGELEKAMIQKISVSDHHINGFSEADSFVLDMERFSQLIEKDIKENSTLTRNLSRKGFGRGSEKKFNVPNVNERDITTPTTSPTTLHGVSCTPEKPIVVAIGSVNTQQAHHHQITIANGNMSSTAAESIIGGKRSSSLRHLSRSTWAMSPRRILLFFATVSSMGTILLIYLTLSMRMQNSNGSSLDY